MGCRVGKILLMSTLWDMEAMLTTEGWLVLLLETRWFAVGHTLAHAGMWNHSFLLFSSFTEIQFIGHTMYLFWMCRPVGFSIFPEFCSHRPHGILEHFCSFPKKCGAHFQSVPILLSPQPQETMAPLYFSMDLPVLDISCAWKLWTMWYIVTDLLCSVQCGQGSPNHHVKRNDILLCGYTRCVPVHQKRAMWLFPGIHCFGKML